MLDIVWTGLVLLWKQVAAKVPACWRKIWCACIVDRWRELCTIVPLIARQTFFGVGGSLRPWLWWSHHNFWVIPWQLPSVSAHSVTFALDFTPTCSFCSYLDFYLEICQSSLAHCSPSPSWPRAHQFNSLALLNFHSFLSSKSRVQFI